MSKVMKVGQCRMCLSVTTLHPVDREGFSISKWDTEQGKYVLPQDARIAGYYCGGCCR